MGPAFIFAGAIAAFMPADKVLRYLGPKANKFTAYGIAAVGGIALALCSCNVVPLFLSIRRRGAGIGPACTFLYSSPAMNPLSMIFVYQVIGWRLGMWRLIIAPVMAILIGLLMTLIWGRREVRQEEAGELVSATDLGGPRYVPFVLALLLALMICGALPTPPLPLLWKAVAMGAIVLAVILLVAKGFGREDLGAWGRETWHLVKTIVPILIPAVLIIGFIAVKTPLLFVNRYLSYRNEYASLYGAIFGALMYFPILTEIAFSKAFLKEFGMGVGPALALLLTGPGLSLPGMILIVRAMGFWRTLTYVVLLVAMATLAGMVFAHYIGPFICPCQQ